MKSIHTRMTPLPLLSPVCVSAEISLFPLFQEVETWDTQHSCVGRGLATSWEQVTGAGTPAHVLLDPGVLRQSMFSDVCKFLSSGKTEMQYQFYVPYSLNRVVICHSPPVGSGIQSQPAFCSLSFKPCL